MVRWWKTLTLLPPLNEYNRFISFIENISFSTTLYSQLLIQTFKKFSYQNRTHTAHTHTHCISQAFGWLLTNWLRKQRVANKRNGNRKKKLLQNWLLYTINFFSKLCQMWIVTWDWPDILTWAHICHSASQPVCMCVNVC